MGLTKYGWQQVYRNFKEQTDLDYENKKLQNKFNMLWRSFHHWQYLQNHTGLGLDSSTGGIAADNSYYGRKGYIAHELITSSLFCGPILNLHYVQTHDPSTQGSRGKPPPFLDELYTLFGRTTHDRGNLISAGGVREPPQSYGNQGTPDDGVGCSNIRSSSKSPIREAIVDSPPKKKMILEEHIANISESICIRNRRTLSRGQEEVDEVVRVLNKDGFEEDWFVLHGKYFMQKWYR
jgi:hypothetical protein